MFVARRVSSTRACSTVLFGDRRANSSDMRCERCVTIVALRWCGLVTVFTNTSVGRGYDGADCTTPTTVEILSLRRTVRPTALGSPPKRSIQYSYERTATGA